MMENARTTSARDHDDRAIIDAADNLATPEMGNSIGGGEKARDIAAQLEEEQIGDPDHHHRVTKETDIHHGDAYGTASRGRGQSGV